MDDNIHSLRDALEWLDRDINEEAHDDGKMSNANAIRVGFIRNMLAKFPLRNCDVGTAEEQDKRFAYQFCMVGIEGCARCKLNTLKHRGNTCGIHWAQMPCKEGGEK